MTFHISGIVILTDEVHDFFRGVGIPPTRIFVLEMSWDINNQQDDQLILIQCTTYVTWAIQWLFAK